ncbi:MAG: oxalate:formate antiporter [Planctomycetes bacterium]|nr:oxalate:formate antiporter [Planctomycetota bacterium]
MRFGKGVPAAHAAFLDKALGILGQDRRLFGVGACGSFLSRRMDEHSDIDLVIGVEDGAHEEVTRERMTIAEGLGNLLSAFTGEHVGDARLVICLYGPPLLHVDLKFLRADELKERVEDPEILWEREGRMTAALAKGVARYPQPDLQWIEDRFWTWVHYATSKIGRGELFESEDCLAFLRGRVLGPLALLEKGARPAGVRRIEIHAPEVAREMEKTLSGHSARAYAEALEQAVGIYRGLRGRLATRAFAPRPAAEKAVMAHLAEVKARLAR